MLHDKSTRLRDLTGMLADNGAYCHFTSSFVTMILLWVMYDQQYDDSMRLISDFALVPLNNCSMCGNSVFTLKPIEDNFFTDVGGDGSGKIVAVQPISFTSTKGEFVLGSKNWIEKYTRTPTPNSTNELTFNWSKPYKFTIRRGVKMMVPVEKITASNDHTHCICDHTIHQSLSDVLIFLTVFYIIYYRLNYLMEKKPVQTHRALRKKFSFLLVYFNLANDHEKNTKAEAVIDSILVPLFFNIPYNMLLNLMIDAGLPLMYSLEDSYGNADFKGPGLWLNNNYLLTAIMNSAVLLYVGLGMGILGNIVSDWDYRSDEARKNGADLSVGRPDLIENLILLAYLGNFLVFIAVTIFFVNVWAISFNTDFAFGKSFGNMFFSIDLQFLNGKWTFAVSGFSVVIAAFSFSTNVFKYCGLCSRNCNRCLGGTGHSAELTKVNPGDD